MTPEQIRKDVDTTYIHVYPKNEKIICELAGNSIVLLAMIDRVLTTIVEKNGVSYAQAISALELLHENPRRVNDTVINKILGDL
jgi:hypothetical protein